MSEREKNGILSLNVKKFLIVHLVWKTDRILQYESLFFITGLILVPIWRGNLPKYGRAITSITRSLFKGRMCEHLDIFYSSITHLMKTYAETFFKNFFSFSEYPVYIYLFESSKVWKKPKYNSFKNKFLIFEIYTYWHFM